MSQEVDPVFNTLFSKLNKEEWISERALQLRVQPQPTIDIEAIKREREAFILEEIERWRYMPKDQNVCGDGHLSVGCNTCGSDLMYLDLLPKLNIYRPDLIPADLSMSQYPALNVSAVLLSHAHMDHCGNIGMLRKDIPIVACTDGQEALQRGRSCLKRRDELGRK